MEGLGDKNRKKKIGQHIEIQVVVCEIFILKKKVTLLLKLWLYTLIFFNSMSRECYFRLFLYFVNSIFEEDFRRFRDRKKQIFINVG